MTADELASWRIFYTLWPFDDLHRYHRPAALVATSLAGGDVQKSIDFLQPPITPHVRQLKPVQVVRQSKE